MAKSVNPFDQELYILQIWATNQGAAVVVVLRAHTCTHTWVVNTRAYEYTIYGNHM